MRIIFFALSLMPVLDPILCKGIDIPSGGENIIMEAVNHYARIGSNDLGSIEVIDVNHDAFDKAFGIEVKKIPDNSYNFQLQFVPQQSFRQGDVYLMSFWARCTESSNEAGDGILTAVIEQRETWDKVLNYSASPGAQWRHFVYGFEGSKSIALEDLNVTMFLGHGIQTLEIAAIEVLSYGTSLKLEDLPVVEIYYDGKDADAPWRQDAAERIERYRKGGLNISVQSSDIATSNAEVSIRMKKHKFAFGSAISGRTYLENKKYRDTFHELFNEAVFENDLKWKTWMWQNDHTYIKSVLDSLDTRNTTGRGHTAIWPGWQYLPEFVEELKDDPSKLKKTLEDHLDEVIGFTKGRLVDWDVMNEPRANHVIQDILGDEIMAEWYIRAKRIDPEVKCFINDYGILTNGGFQQNYQNEYHQTIEYIESMGGAIDGIGIQGHFAEAVTGIPRVLSILDRFAGLGKEIKVTEFDVNSTNDELKTSYTRDFITALFSHPYVSGVLCWGFWAGQHWKPAAAYIDQDWNYRPNGEVFRRLIHEDWWTPEESQNASPDGKVNFGDVFLGNYEITVTHDSKTIVANADIHYNDINHVTIDIGTDSVTISGQNHPETPVFAIAEPLEPEVISSTDQDDHFASSVINIFPNPCQGSINILSGNSELRTVRINDLSGRCLYSAKATGERHSIDANLKRGVYVLIVQAGGKIHEKKLVFN